MKETININKIVFHNRYKDKVYLEYVSDNTYKLIIDTPLGNAFTRYGYDSWPDKIEFVDPSGGPFITIGENNISCYIDGEEKSINFIVDKIYVTIEEDLEKIKDTFIEISNLKIKNDY